MVVCQIVIYLQDKMTHKMRAQLIFLALRILEKIVFDFMDDGKLNGSTDEKKKNDPPS